MSIYNCGELFCDYLKITDNQLRTKISAWLLTTDLSNYFEIKKVALKINELKLGISHSKIIDFIAKSLGYKNNHVLKNALTQKNEDSNLLKAIELLYKESGSQALLPHNLPDDLLNACSLQFQCFREMREGVSYSLLILAVFLVLSKDALRKSNEFRIKMEREDVLFRHVDTYGIFILLEEMKRMNIIDIQDKYLPTVNNIFNQKPSTTYEILVKNEEIFNFYQNN